MMGTEIDKIAHGIDTDFDSGMGFTDDDHGELVGGKGQFDTMYEEMARLARVRMDSVLAFLDAAVYKPEDRDFVYTLVPIGMLQLTARCNHRYSRLRNMRVQLANSLSICGYPDILREDPIEEWREDRIMTPLPITKEIVTELETMAQDAGIVSDYVGAIVLPNPARRTLDLIGAIVTIQVGIRRSIIKGTFRDYTRLYELFATCDDPYKILGIENQLPSFLRRAWEVVKISQSGKMYSHNQAPFGRMVAEMALEIQSAQRGSQKGRWSFNRNNNNGGDNNENSQ